MDGQSYTIDRSTHCSMTFRHSQMVYGNILKMNYRFSHIVVIFVLFFLPACQQGNDSPDSTSKVHHVVICWLKDSGNKKAGQKIIEASRGFLSIPGVVDVRVGSVIHSEREIVDSSFDVAIYLSFENEQKLQDYLVHPIHKNAVEETLKPLVRKVVIYDFIE